jgi:hypothetical protein
MVSRKYALIPGSECEVFEMKVEVDMVVFYKSEPLGKPGSEARATSGNAILASRGCFFLAASHDDKSAFRPR